MSVHTMPSMSLICEDFIKSMVTANVSKLSSSFHSNSNNSTSNGALTTRLNGEQNGNGNHNDSYDEDDNETHGSDYLIGEVHERMTNASSLSSSSHKIRKNLMNKMKELKSKQKVGLSGNNQSLLPAIDVDQESKLKSIAMVDIHLNFY